MTLDALAIGGTILSSVAAVYALSQILLSRKAETHLLMKLVTEKHSKHLLAQFDNLTVRNQEGRLLNEEEMGRLRSEIVRIVETLDSQDKERIKDALYQPSIEGRANYLSKLAEESAKTLEHQLQPSSH